MRAIKVVDRLAESARLLSAPCFCLSSVLPDFISYALLEDPTGLI